METYGYFSDFEIDIFTSGYYEALNGSIALVSEYLSNQNDEYYEYIQRNVADFLDWPSSMNTTSLLPLLVMGRIKRLQRGYIAPVERVLRICSTCMFRSLSPHHAYFVVGILYSQQDTEDN